jgi:hypothetical protein
MTAMVRSCGGIGPPPSRLNLRPIRVPSMMAPAIATHPPIECTTVEPRSRGSSCRGFERNASWCPSCARNHLGPSTSAKDRVDKTETPME